ncbi:hypothetical protein OTU49_017186, partial [Cherax quadricarinatus]
VVSMAAVVGLLRCIYSAGGRGMRSMAAVVAAPRHPTLLTTTTTSLPGSEQKRTYAMRLELTEHGIVWRRPEYVPSWKPEKSGDLDLHTDPDEGHARLQVLPSKWAMDEVDDITKKLLSLKFSTHDEFMKIARYKTMRKIQRHQYDTGSLEVK